MFKTKSISLLFLLIFLSTVTISMADDYTDAQMLVDKSSVVFKSFSDDPGMSWFQHNVQYAKAVFIVPQMLKAGFFLGGSGGTGTLLARNMKTGSWGYPVFYSMGSVSFGLQFGGEASEIILMVMTDKGMDSLLTTSFKLGADATVAAGPVGAGAKAATADILAFARSKGAFAGVSIEGAVIQPRKNLNASYYGKPVSPADVVIRHSVTNPHADNLRSIVSKNTVQQKRTVNY